MYTVLDKKPAMGLCSTCYRELFATIEYRDDGAAYITKTCPVHGYEEYMVEKDWKFWDEAYNFNPSSPTQFNYVGGTCIEITDRCNVKCKHCYHGPDNSIPDLPAEHIIARARKVSTPRVILMGAEPTMRSDLPYLIKEISKPGSIGGGLGKGVSIYTNGVKLSSLDYTNELADAGLDNISISIHNADYHKDGIWRNIQTALNNVRTVNKFKVHQLSFTVESKKDVQDAVEKIIWLKENNLIPFNFCIRSPAEIGVPFEQQEEIFASKIFSWIKEVTTEKGLSFYKDDTDGNNPYHIACKLDGMTVQVIHWASVKNIDTTYMNMGPWAQFVPGTIGTFLLQTILREGWKKGWWQGQRLVDDTSTQTIKFI